MERAREERWATGLECSRTGAGAPLDEPAFLSPAGAPWLVEYGLDAGRGEWWRAELARRPWSMWRYRELLPVAELASRVDLGEGATPLVDLSSIVHRRVELLVKEEGGNPTGSFKARGLAVAITRARELGAPAVELASAGNAAVALSAYAAAAGLPARVAVPEPTPAKIERRCRALGAEVYRHGETLVEARERLAALEGEAWDLSTFREPYRVEGKKTMGLEVAEQLGWRAPDWIVYPTGGGTGVVGMDRAFRQLAELGLLEGPGPRFAVVQMEGCAPLVEAYRDGRSEARPWARPETDVWGLRVPKALADFLVLDVLRRSQGVAVAVSETVVSETQRWLAKEAGFLAGPEGAAAVAGADRLVAEGTIGEGERVVVFQTGHVDAYG